MGNQFELQAETRTTQGSANARRLRLADKIPAVIYGADKDPVSLVMSHKDISIALENEAIYTRILTLSVDGKAEQVVLKKVQRHVFKPKIMHVDFLRIKAKEKITMNIPIHYIGEENSAGVKAGGILSKLVNEVEIRCLPQDLPEFFDVDITGLGLDQSLHLSDIKFPSNIELGHEISDEHNPAIINIYTPKAEAEATDEASASDDTAGTDSTKDDSSDKE